MPKSGTKSIQVLTTTTSNYAYGSIAKMGVGFYRTNQSPGKGIKNIYIITATDYITKWVETRALKDNTARFIFEEIITKFGCPIELVSDRESHVLNETI
jgi:hypothetical protein